MDQGKNVDDNSPAGAFLKGAKHAACVLTPYVAGIAAGAATANPVYGILAYPAAGLLLEPVCGPPDPGNLPGAYGIPFLGGQCQESYCIKFTATNVILGDTSGQFSCGMMGPITGLDWSHRDVGGNLGWDAVVYRGDTVVGGGHDFVYTDPAGDVTCFLARQDGGVDDCGNRSPTYLPNPGSPGLPPPSYPQLPWTPDGRPQLPGTNIPQPYLPPGFGKPIYLPIVTPPIVLPISPSFPITIPLNVSGTLAGTLNIYVGGSITIKYPDGTIAQQVDLSEITDLLSLMKTEMDEIKACACRPLPGGSFEIVQIPYLPAGTDCSPSVFPLSVEPGSLDTAKALLLQQTVSKAVEGCKKGTPPQLPETEIFSARTYYDSEEIFSPLIGPEVHSVRLQIHQFSGSSREITSFPSASQYKFGSFCFSLPPLGSAGDSVYVFDQSTFLTLPTRVGRGYIRLLLKPGTSFTLYDTGERL